jgi:hypothetical protein
MSAITTSAVDDETAVAAPTQSLSSDQPTPTTEGSNDYSTNDDDNNKNNHSQQRSNHTTPLACQFEPAKNMFRVTRSKGNTLSSRGFGVVFPRDENEQQTSSTSSSDTYLFIEETVVLCKQGLMEARDEHNNLYSQKELFDKMETLNISWPVFLVYAHLRQQTFRVVRHTPSRREILLKMQQNQEHPSQTTARKKELSQLKRLLRLDTAHASPPRNFVNDTFIASDEIVPAFDVYHPSSSFAKTNPGLPDFSIAITSYAQCSFHFQQWHSLVASKNHKAIKIAAVSDAGIVLVFGITKVGVPAINAATTTTTQEELAGGEAVDSQEDEEEQAESREDSDGKSK